MSTGYDNGMRPKMGATSMSLPITFDYSGGRRESNRSRKFWSVIISIVCFIVGLGIMFNKQGSFFFNILYGLVFMFVASLFVRFILLKEAKVRRAYISLLDSDYEKDNADIWGIYSIEDQYPFYCRFRNGKSGLFVRLNKDVILGKFSEAQFEHYEAISDALNVAGGSKVQICHVDYMDNVGTDERIEESFIQLSEVTNPDLKDVLTDIFTYQQEQMMERVTTFDVYLFMWNGSDINAWSTIQRILSCFLEANYRSYHVLDQTDLRELGKVLFNLHDFSVNDAISTAFTTNDSYSGITPISLVKADGEEIKLDKTFEEKKLEREQKIKAEEARKAEIKRRKAEKKSKKNKKKEEEIDLM